MYDKSLICDILKDMITAVEKIETRCSKVSCMDDFLYDEDGQILLDSICMLLIAVGEAVKQIDKITNKTLFKQYPQIEWKKVAGMRDILSHHYFDINAETVYGLCQNRIKPLKKSLQNIYDDIEANKN